MKIIFLDIDGVMVPFWGAGHSSAMSKNNKWDAEPFCSKAVKILNDILELTDAEIVISSDWRDHYDLPTMREIFKANGVNKLPIGYTKNSKLYKADDLEGGRVDEIRDWVQTHRVKHWVSIDDLDMFDLEPHFAHCKRVNEGIKQNGVKEKILKALEVEDTV
jgi:hypothetical protein